MKHVLRAVALVGATAFFSFAQSPARRLDLSGSWSYEGGRIFLPGSTDQAGYGTLTSGAEKGWLSRPAIFEGPVTYEREVVIPEGWRGLRVSLFLERVHWQSTVKVDGRGYGSENSLTTPHVYELGSLPPGRHRLTVTVDNSYLVNVGRNAHSVTEHTQTNWNGIVGRMELRATAPVWIDDVQVYGGGRVEVVLKNATGKRVAGRLSWSGGTAAVAEFGEEQRVKLTVAEPAGLWDEDEGRLARLKLTLEAGGMRDEQEVTYGRRTFETKEGQFVLNGRPMLLRGTLECDIFPKTGYPPTDEAAWARIIGIAREHGLNSFRFHSWCPPEAAFAAADKAGFLFYVELPVWHDKVGLDEKLDGFMRREGFRMLKSYGNHPSFVALGLGNELRGDFKFMDNLVGEFIQADPRRLITFSADHVRLEPGETSEFFIAQRTKGGYLRVHGTRWTKEASGTDFDYTDRVKAIPVPVVAHELGQWVTYPDYAEIGKYTGVLKARNLEAFREQAEKNGLSGMSAAFQRASGRFAWQLYKEDVETILRTPRMGGYQLLQLQDFPGQGEALIGLLDSFWDSKGILTPEETRRFAGPTVVLARFKKFVWTSGEEFTAKAQLAHYGKTRLRGEAEWALTDEAGKQVSGGKLQAADAAPGQVGELGSIRVPLSGFTRAARLTLRVRAAGYANEWPLWVYPDGPAAVAPADVLVTKSWAEAKRRLSEGGKVLLLAKAGRTQAMDFLPVFWSLSWFPKQAGTMGVLCDAGHPALKEFPNEGHSNWQWWELTEGSKAFILDGLSEGLRPVVQVMDDYHRNHRLAAVVEARVGKGRLVAVSFDLESGLEKRPVARQLLTSLLGYMGSAGFEPGGQVGAEEVSGLFEGRP